MAVLQIELSASFIQTHGLTVCDRKFGCDAPVGIIYGINPFIIIFLVTVLEHHSCHLGSVQVVECSHAQTMQRCCWPPRPLLHALLCAKCSAPVTLQVPLVGALFTRVQHFDMIHYGSYLSALSPFWLVAFPQGVPSGRRIASCAVRNWPCAIRPLWREC